MISVPNKAHSAAVRGVAPERSVLWARDLPPEPAPDATATPERPSKDSGQRLLDLVKAHHEGVWRFLRRLGLSTEDAEDALQEAILVLAKRLAAVPTEAERSFFYGTAWRVAHGLWRRRSRRAEVSEDPPSNLTAPCASQEALLEQREMRELLDQILAQMPEETRSTFVLHEIEGFAMANIARILSLPPGTVASRLRRGRADFDQRVARLNASMRDTRRNP